MKNEIIIHAAPNQNRVALIENGELAQLFIESPENQRTVGNIYLAEVHKVMTGIRAAFLNIGGQKDAFLHFSDIGEHLENYLIMLNGEKVIPRKEQRKKAEPENKEQESASIVEEQNRIGSYLASKQKILAQIVKEPIGSKGPRVSTNITVAGRFLVLIPMGEYVAVSKRIRSQKERRRLRSCISSVLPEGFGVIVRTLAEGQKKEILHEDLKDVLDKWNGILEKLKGAKPPALLHHDMDITESLIRDLFAKDYSRILIDDARMYRSIKSYVSRVAPEMVSNIELYRGSRHIFDFMNISRDVESVFSPRVKMPSGGYLIFEQTEAMYVVDVNSGRYAAKREQEDNSLKTNLEAAREIAKQLRLRDIGGIIVVDFIDLKEETNQKKIYDELKREFRKDRAKTNVLPMSNFGLIQITRQRIRPSVVKSVSKVCPMCGGSGNIVSQNTIIADINSWLTTFKHNYRGYLTLDLHLNPFLKSMLEKGWITQGFKWLFSFRISINMIADETLSMNDFRFMLPNSDIDITHTVLNHQPLEKAITETQLRESRGKEKKKDDSELDYFDNKQKGPGKNARNNVKKLNNASGSSKRKPPGPKKGSSSAKEKNQTGRKPSNQNKEASAGKPSSQTGINKEEHRPTHNRGGAPPASSRARASQSKAKYYKSTSSTEPQINEKSQAPKSQKEKTSEEKNNYPSAVEIAEKHRMEREKKTMTQTKEDQGKDKNVKGDTD